MTCISRDAARERALEAIAALADRVGLTELVIVDDGVVETEVAWYFPYDSAAYVERGEVSAALAGNLPVMVRKDGSEVTFTSPD